MEIKTKGQKLRTVTSFKYFGEIASDGPRQVVGRAEKTLLGARCGGGVVPIMFCARTPTLFTIKAEKV